MVRIAAVFFLFFIGLAEPVLAAQHNQNAADDQVNYKDDAAYDPLENINRGIYRFNRVVDFWVLRPASVFYRDAIPAWGRDRVSNFVNNLGEPVVFANSVLQGNVGNAFATFWRFIINTTFGIGGLFDQAGYAGLRNKNLDFGLTLGVYGFRHGPYIVIPILGPASVRDTVGRVADVFMDPINYAENSVRLTALGLRTINRRTHLLGLTDHVDRTSLDPYATYRTLYIQRRARELEEAKQR